MDVSPALLVDRVLQTQQGASEQAAQMRVLKEALDTQEAASAALLNSVAGSLPLAPSGSVGTQLNALV